MTAVQSAGVDPTWTSWAVGCRAAPAASGVSHPPKGLPSSKRTLGFHVSHAETNVCPGAGQQNFRPPCPALPVGIVLPAQGRGPPGRTLGPGASFKNTHLFSHNKVKFEKHFPSRADRFSHHVPRLSSPLLLFSLI